MRSVSLPGLELTLDRYIPRRLPIHSLRRPLTATGLEFISYSSGADVSLTLRSQGTCRSCFQNATKRSQVVAMKSGLATE
jgi:hypothetical protein